MTRAVLASANPGKLREFADLLAPFAVQLIPQAELAIRPATAQDLPAVLAFIHFRQNHLPGARRNERHFMFSQWGNETLVR